MRDLDEDAPLTEEELELARRGERLIAAAVDETRAPQSLRESIEAGRERTRAPQRVPFWRRYGWALGGAGLAAMGIAVFTIALQTGGETAEPSLSDIYAAARLAPAEPAPAPAGGDPPVLDAAVGTLEFPDWREKFDWRAVGRRDEEVDGREVTTVYYGNPEGARLAYSVVEGDPLGGRPAGDEIERDGNTYSVARGAERTTVTWTQDGHTCVIVAPSRVPESTLVDLAASRND